MRLSLFAAGAVVVPLVTFAALPAADKPAKADVSSITWKKTVLDKAFRSEGATIADVNKDGKMDVLNGEMWYEAPDWKPHEIRKLGDYGDGLRGYSNSFACWAEDFNGDGFPDLIVVGFPGKDASWFENPKGKDGHWTMHRIADSACNETPTYVDLFGNGKRVLLMGWQPGAKNNEGEMCYFVPAKDATKPWERISISGPSKPGAEVPGTQRFSHGLGVGDLNGDGRNDVFCTGGWWEQPAKPDGTPWKFHKAGLGEACADMFAYDVDGDGKADVVSSSAHKFGIWWHQQKPGTDGPAWVKHVLFPELVSETHAMHCVDINNDGMKDLVTGKRWWSHGKNEPGSDKPSMVTWLEAKKGADGVVSFTPRVIDEDSGIGTQFCVADINGDGLLDVITSNKKGTFVMEQVRKK